MAEKEDLRHYKELTLADLAPIAEKQESMERKIDGIYIALMGNELMGEGSGLIARSVRTETKVDAIEKDVAQYKNMVKGMWAVIMIASVIIGWLIEKAGILK